MYNPEHHLHTMDIIREASKKIFDEYFNHFGFKEKDITSKFYSTDYEEVKFQKKSIQIFLNISKREAYEFAFRNTTWPEEKRVFICDFEAVFSDNLEMVRGFAADYILQASKFERYSVNWYYQYMKSDIEFILKYFPEVFSNSDLSRFERKLRIK